MKKIFLADEKKFNEKLNEIKKQKPSNIQVISDFDRTITKYKINNNQFVHSLTSIIKEDNLLPKEYREKATELFEYYHPKEIDLSIPCEEKKVLMENWIKRHMELLIKYNLNLETIEKQTSSKKLKFRKYLRKIVYDLNELGIPFIVMSASDSGSHAICRALKKKNIDTPNVFVIANEFVWDNENKKIQDIKKPIIHPHNKSYEFVKFSSFYKNVKNREYGILLGDSIGDIDMVDSFDQNKTIKVGFLNEKENENLNKYLEKYDVVITNESSFKFVYDIINSIKKNNI